MGVRTVLICGALFVWMNTALGQERDSKTAPSGKDPSHAVAQLANRPSDETLGVTKKPKDATRAPELKPLAPAQIFARAFEYFRQEKFADAEELFLAGLTREDKDPRAWEWLARTQAAMNKIDDAQRSLQEAVSRGLAKDREDQARLEIAYAFPGVMPPEVEACLAPSAIESLRKVRVPRRARAYELEYELWPQPRSSGPTPLPTAAKAVFSPRAPGVFAAEYTFSQSASERASISKDLLFLAGLQSCNGARIELLTVSGTVFPMRPGGKFAIQTSVRYAERHVYAVTTSCIVGEAVVAGPEAMPSHPVAGDLIPVSCDSSANGQTIKTELFFSSHLGSFLRHPRTFKQEVRQYRMRVGSDQQ
jgi:hypothetical protein